MTLPKAFIDDILPHLPAAEHTPFLDAITESDATTCVRHNMAKPSGEETGEAVAWCPEGRYLDERPNFTLDPLMHAGCYYVQEASSQFVTHVIRHLIHQPVTALDLCASPGGKSTAMLSALPEGSILVSNEIDRRRARILAENVTKWGLPNVAVTCNAPADFARMHHCFDLILTDVPCSGEGMFRKDEGAVSDWSPAKVEGCVSLQREILRTIWPTLRPGGILIYSTCTYNVHEDEEMLRYISEELGATPLDIPVLPEWHIHPPLMGTDPCYRFMPHFTRGEGLFMAAVRKDEDEATHASDPGPVYGNSAKRQGKKAKKGHDQYASKAANNKQPDLKALAPRLLSQLTIPTTLDVTPEGTLRAIPEALRLLHDRLVAEGLYLLQSGIELGTVKGRDIIPSHALALSTCLQPDAFPQAEVALDTALDYLRHKAITLPEGTPVGYVLICYGNHPLGFVKNIGNRCNNLYPAEWRIRFL